MIKNAFNFILKALFVLKIFKILSCILDHVKKRLDKKARVNFEIYDITTWKQTITIHILPNVSRSKEN